MVNVAGGRYSFTNYQEQANCVISLRVEANNEAELKCIESTIFMIAGVTRLQNDFEKSGSTFNDTLISNEYYYQRVNTQLLLSFSTD